MKINKLTLACVAMTGCLGALNASAQIASGDLILGFRSTSVTSSNLVVDVGSLSSLLTGSSTTISTVSASQLISTFGSLNNLYFSAFAYADPASADALGYPSRTLFLSRQRTDINTQTTPSLSLSSSAQGSVIGQLAGIASGVGATGLGAYAISPGVYVTPSTLSGSGNLSYSLGIENNLVGGSISGNIHGTWGRYPVEGLTSSTFSTDTTPVVLDLYEQDPGTANTGVYLGAFNFGNDGSLTFNPVPEPSTFAMFGAGVLALTAARRFGRKN